MHMLAIAIATIVSYLLGSLWYSPFLFGPTWQREIGLNPEHFKSSGAMPFIITFIYTLITAFGFSFLIQGAGSLFDMIKTALIVGLLIVAPSLGINYQFSGRNMVSFLIDAGYHVARIALFALVFWYIRQ